MDEPVDVEPSNLMKVVAFFPWGVKLPYAGSCCGAPSDVQLTDWSQVNPNVLVVASATYIWLKLRSMIMLWD